MTGEQIIRLGKTLVDQLDSKDGDDLLSKWIAHHITELLAGYERSSGHEKEIIWQKYFEAILTLWKQRANFPKGRKPFEKFDSVLEALDAINPNNPKPYYYRESSNSNVPPLATESKDVRSLVKCALNLDVAARELVTYTFSQAILKATDSRTKKYLKACSEVLDEKDIYTVTLLIESLSKSQDVKSELEKAIEHLDAFISIGSMVREDLALQLNNENESGKKVSSEADCKT